VQTYSLAALYEARQAAVDAAERIVAQRIVDCAEADRHGQQAQARLAELRARIQAQAQSQLNRAREGQATVADLQVGAAFGVAAQKELDALTLALQRTESTAAECRALLGQAQHQVELLRQELAIVERHRQNFLAEERRIEEAEAEEDAAELWQAHQSTFPHERSK